MVEKVVLGEVQHGISDQRLSWVGSCDRPAHNIHRYGETSAATVRVRKSIAEIDPRFLEESALS
jgi:hypothetical protein